MTVGHDPGAAGARPRQRPGLPVRRSHRRSNPAATLGERDTGTLSTSTETDPCRFRACVILDASHRHVRRLVDLNSSGRSGQPQKPRIYCTKHVRYRNLWSRCGLSLWSSRGWRTAGKCSNPAAQRETDGHAQGLMQRRCLGKPRDLHHCPLSGTKAVADRAVTKAGPVREGSARPCEPATGSGASARGS